MTAVTAITVTCPPAVTSCLRLNSMAIEDFKKEHFNADFRDRPFPFVESVSAPQRLYFRNGLAFGLGMPQDAEPLDILRRLQESLEAPPSYDATDSSFDLELVARDLNLGPINDVYINWDRFDHVDRMHFGDLAKYFKYVWYSVSDDIEIFDQTLRWVIVIRHDGALSFVPLLRR